MLALGAGCGESETRSEEPPATSTLSASASATSAVDPVAAGTQAAMAAYRGMWAAFVAASNKGATDPPGLAQHTAGSALQTLKAGLAANDAQGLTSKGNPTMAPKLTAIGPIAAPTSATITDCVDDSRWLLYRTNGQLADDVPGGRRLATARVEKSGEAWKVTSFALQRTGTC